MARVLWVTDADNTLWDTNELYRDAQLNLLSAVESEVRHVAPETQQRLDFVRKIDQALAKADHRGLKYPPEMLVSALANILRNHNFEKTIKTIISGNLYEDARALNKIVSNYISALNSMPELRRGVKKGLASLRAVDAKIFLLSEGSQDRIKRTLEYHGLSTYIDSILIAEKNENIFRRIRMIEPSVVSYVIGDQLDRDILPAVAAGFHGFYFKGGFTPVWTLNEKELQHNCIFVDSYSDAVEKIKL